jgi:hypothetical protein
MRKYFTPFKTALLLVLLLIINNAMAQPKAEDAL